MDLLDNIPFMLLLARELNNSAKNIPPDGGLLRAREFAFRLRESGIEFSMTGKDYGSATR